MKLTKLRPCDKCGGAVYPQFYVLKFSLAFINPDSVNKMMGMAQFLGGGENGMSLASVFTDTHDAVKIAGKEDKALWNELYVCQNCMIEHYADLMILAEKVSLNQSEENAEDKND